MKCIYCRVEDASKFTSVEHVFPQSFGTFGTETPTLKGCVCHDCNQYFKKELDQLLARESMEGVTRYNKGIFSRDPRVQRQLVVKLPDRPEMGVNAGVLVWIDGTTGKIREPLPQVHFKNPHTGKHEVIRGRDLGNLDWKAKGYSDRDLKIFAPSAEELDLLVQDLKKIGINFTKHSQIANPFETEGKTDQQFDIQIEGTIDHEIKRALLKILMNFAAKYIGCDEVLKSEWDKCRKYVRFNGDPIPARITTKPFWGEESQHLRFEDDSYNIRIENVGTDVMGVIQLFNLYTYEFKVVENYSIACGKEVAARFTPGERTNFGIQETPGMKFTAGSRQPWNFPELGRRPIEGVSAFRHPLVVRSNILASGRRCAIFYSKHQGRPVQVLGDGD